MLLTLTSTTEPATDLGYLLHKHPGRVHTANLTFGKAHVFYPEATPNRCTAALLVEVDPIGLVRGRRGPAGEGRTLEHYVNDRPYVASSFLSVALADVFATALSGRSKDRPELVAREMPLEAHISVLPCRGGESFLRRLFEPLGYVVEAKQYPLDETNDAWGPSRYFTVKLKGTKRVSELLTHLYVLMPVLDDDKHYWVGDDEVDKLVRRGEGWLATHPERETIAKRYLKHQHSLSREALEQIMADEIPAVDEVAEAHEREEAEIEQKISLQQQRIGVVLAALKQCNAKRVLDLGCGEGHLVKALLGDKSFEEILAVDVSHRALEVAGERLHLDRMPDKQKARLKLLQGSLMYRDKRLAGYDAAAIVEVIEHLDPPKLTAFERVVFEFARPTNVIVTTPNAEYNVKFDNLPAGRMRHHDHRFEWTRAEFHSWAERIADRFRYHVRYLPIGPEDSTVGAPTQMAVFSL